ncbi:Skt5p [Sugiyamaella lignohabitans]|uniref:Skt5p n=1 Tax=Sugiyamaella lignohabitans TaxID=796027 RepID=A0A167FQI3_9ASCO|nr:Skt5p [Sugiyamaella lignohabitans]ANB15568.1 Skt5p [Sugiyamaella lignohabitans]
MQAVDSQVTPQLSPPHNDSYRGVTLEDGSGSPIAAPQSTHTSPFHYARHPQSHYRSVSGNSITQVRGTSSSPIRNSPHRSSQLRHSLAPNSLSPSYQQSPYHHQRQPSPLSLGEGDYQTTTNDSSNGTNQQDYEPEQDFQFQPQQTQHPNGPPPQPNFQQSVPQSLSHSQSNPQLQSHSQSVQQAASQLQPLPLPRPHSDARFARPRSSNSSLDSAYRYSDPENLPMPNYGHSRQVSSASLSEQASQSASASMFDLSQSYISTQFGPKSAALMPRIQTIEMYRKNAKKSNDPVIQFQFAQYMLQTALLSSTPGKSNRQSMFATDLASSASSTTTGSSSSEGTGNNGANAGVGIRSSMYSTKSLGADDEKKIKRDLLKEAISILRKLSDRGFADAQYLLADALASGALGKPDLRESFSLFQLAAKHGHGEAAYRAALCLEQGWGTSKDIRRAVQFLRMAASRNQPGAMLRLGMACFYGRMGMSNTPQVKQEGIKWLKLAANEANEIFPQAPYELAKIVEVGYSDIVIPDQHWAVQLYVKSSELNYIPASRVLGKAYELALLGCPRDAALSIHYYTLGAIKGDPESMYSMCAWYMMGAEPILQKNEEEAYEWALRAANAGHPKAQFAIGYFLEHGVGVERDILQSSFWYHKAAEAGNEHAISRLAKEKSQQAKNKKASKDMTPGSSKDKECIIS